MDPEDFDVIIVGAGLSGINSAYLLQQLLPGARYVVLEARDVMGGTWSFWQYPGIRTDSPSTTFCFSWFPWPHGTNFADAGLVYDYLVMAARSQDIDHHVRLHQRVEASRWSSADQLWTLDVADTHARGLFEPSAGHARQYRAHWVLHCSGYYSYDTPRQVVIPGLDHFRGPVVHPQFWAGRPGDSPGAAKQAAQTAAAAIAGRRVVLVGSGATAVTMLPSLAQTAGHVTLLQRSPSYVVALPRFDALTALLRSCLPRRLADWLNWWAHMVEEQALVHLVLRFPRLGRLWLRSMARRQLPPAVDVDVHFNPGYDPLMQRLCMTPDGDFFATLYQPNCAIVTGSIDTVTADGIRVRDSSSGSLLDLPADTIITATGLHIQLMNGQWPLVDGEPVSLHDRFTWRGCMLEGVPNAAFILGYVTTTWTPGADVHCRTVLGVIRQMRRLGATSAWPTVDPAVRPRLPQLPALDYSSGYMVAARDRLPLSSGRYPWIFGLGWVYDQWYLLFGSPRDSMVFRSAKE